MTIAPSVFPELVSVPVALNVVVPEYVTVIVDDKVNEPEIVNVGDDVPAKVPENPVQLIDFATLDPEIVQVTTPEAALKKTSSAAVGTDAPPAPPDVADHFVPAVPSQFAVPPTQ
jgi:hypothetical protein